MKGIKSDEFIELMNFVQKYHKFALYKNNEELAQQKKDYPKMSHYGLNCKYIETCYDTRFSDIWLVKFRIANSSITFFTNSYHKVPYERLFDWIMAFLKGEWNPTDEQRKEMSENKSNAEVWEDACEAMSNWSIELEMMEPGDEIPKAPINPYEKI